jgi:hypothetical protein
MYLHLKLEYFKTLKRIKEFLSFSLHHNSQYVFLEYTYNNVEKPSGTLQMH